MGKPVNATNIDGNLRNLRKVFFLRHKRILAFLKYIPFPVIVNLNSLTCEITALTEKINSLDEDIIEKTELIKEYLQILKDGTDVGLNPPSAVHGPLEYFEKKICDLGNELLSIDEKLISSRKQLTEMGTRLEEVIKVVKETGYIKIFKHGFIIGENMKWVAPDEAEEYLNCMFVERIV